MAPKRRQANITTLARILRRNMTVAERVLWKQLRAKRFADAKFNRQAPIGRYIADFCSFQNGLIVEIDGGQHDKERTSDRERTELLATEGFRVIRFWNNEVLTNLDGVMFRIEQALKSTKRP